jgi:hypothetical protein
VRATFLELLIGAAATKGGHVTDAILASGLSRAWTTYYWFLEYGRWSWLQVWQVLPGMLTALFASTVLHLIVDDTVVERISTRAPGSGIHHKHHAKPGTGPPSCVARAGCASRTWSNGAGKRASCR